MTRQLTNKIGRFLLIGAVAALTAGSAGQTLEQRMEAILKQHSPIPLSSFRRTERTDEKGRVSGMTLYARNDAWSIRVRGTIVADTIEYTTTPYAVPLAKSRVNNLRAVAVGHADAMVSKGILPFSPAIWKRMKANAKMNGNELRITDRVAGIDGGTWGNMVELAVDPGTGKVTRLQTSWDRTYLTEGATLPVSQLQAIAQRSVKFKLRPGVLYWMPIGPNEKVKTLRRVFYAGADDGGPYSVRDVRIDAVTGKVIPPPRYIPR